MSATVEQDGFGLTSVVFLCLTSVGMDSSSPAVDRCVRQPARRRRFRAGYGSGRGGSARGALLAGARRRYQGGEPSKPAGAPSRGGEEDLGAEDLQETGAAERRICRKREWPRRICEGGSVRRRTAAEGAARRIWEWCSEQDTGCEAGYRMRGGSARGVWDLAEERAVRDARRSQEAGRNRDGRLSHEKVVSVFLVVGDIY